MTATPEPAAITADMSPPNDKPRPFQDAIIDLLRCPVSGRPLRLDGGELRTADGNHTYPISEDGIPLLVDETVPEEARIQQAHYDHVADGYIDNLGLPHTEEYMSYMDGQLDRALGEADLGVLAEICCGHGEAVRLMGDRSRLLVALDISYRMLKSGRAAVTDPRVAFVQGDATRLPMADGAFDTVVMLGGVHQFNDRAALFAEIWRILKKDGRFVFREPVSDFPPWRWIRRVIYRFAPNLDEATERPLLWKETVPLLRQTGFAMDHWNTFGLVGFALFMNSDVLVFNRLFRFIPAIRAITRAFIFIDDTVVRIPGLRGIGMQVVGVARKV